MFSKKERGERGRIVRNLDGIMKTRPKGKSNIDALY